MTEPSVAVVGGGYWGKNLVRNFHGLGALRTVCDTDPTRLAAFREEFGIQGTESYADVLADPDIRAVALATPAEAHAKMVRRALDAGKDVFVEKPLALTAEEGRELVEVAREKGRILMVGHLLHYHGAVRKLKQLVKDGTLGRVRYVYSNRLNLGKFRREENILWSFAPHDVSVVLALAAETPEQLACQGGAYLHDEIADVTVSTLSFASGMRAHIFVSWLHPYKEQKLVVVGSKRMAVFDDREPEDKLLVYGHQIEWKEGMPIPLKGEAEAVPYDRAEPLREECAHFLTCVDERRTPVTDGEEGLRVLEVLGQLQKSLDRGGLPVRPATEREEADFFAHETATVDAPASEAPPPAVRPHAFLARPRVPPARRAHQAPFPDRDRRRGAGGGAPQARRAVRGPLSLPRGADAVLQGRPPARDLALLRGLRRGRRRDLLRRALRRPVLPRRPAAPGPGGGGGDPAQGRARHHQVGSAGDQQDRSGRSGGGGSGDYGIGYQPDARGEALGVFESEE